MSVVYLLCLSSLNFVFFSAGSRFCSNVFSCTYPVKILIINVDLIVHFLFPAIETVRSQPIQESFEVLGDMTSFASKRI